MRVPHDALDFLVALVLFLQLISVGQRLFLSGQQWLNRISCLTLPDSHIGVLRAGDNVLGIVGVENGVDLLHTLCVVDFPRPTVVEGEDSDRLVEAGCYELLASGCEIDVQNC